MKRKEHTFGVVDVVLVIIRTAAVHFAAFDDFDRMILGISPTAHYTCTHLQREHTGPLSWHQIISVQHRCVVPIVALLLVVADHATVAIRCVVSSGGGHSSGGGTAVVVVVCWRWRRSHRTHFLLSARTGHGQREGGRRDFARNSEVWVEIVIRVSENRPCLVSKTNQSEGEGLNFSNRSGFLGPHIDGPYKPMGLGLADLYPRSEKLVSLSWAQWISDE